MSSWLWYIIVGFVVGVVAKLLMPGRDPKGCIITILIGIGGGFVGGYLGRVLGIYPDGHWGQFIASVIGAMILLLLLRVIRGRE